MFVFFAVQETLALHGRRKLSLYQFFCVCVSQTYFKLKPKEEQAKMFTFIYCTKQTEEHTEMLRCSVPYGMWIIIYNRSAKVQHLQSSWT